MTIRSFVLNNSLAKVFCGLALSLPLAGCYTVNQARFAAHVADTVHEKMPVETAIARLQADGFSCDPMGKFGQTHTCTKTRQSLLPYTCMERVNVKPSAHTLGGSAIEVRPIVCAGL